MNVCIFSKYRDIFGKPNTGVHRYRIMDVAMVDYIMTIIGAFILSYLTYIPVEITTIFLFLSGIILHIIFGVETNTSKFIKKITNNSINCINKK
jgi:hypothetical protein